MSFEKNAIVTCILGYEGYLNSSYNLVREFSAQNFGFQNALVSYNVSCRGCCGGPLF